MTNRSSKLNVPGELKVWDATPRAQAAPVRAAGRTQLHPASVPGFSTLDLGELFNRTHDSMLIGGGDDASFLTWFTQDEVLADKVPFLVRRTGSDVVVSANNTTNVFEISGIDASAEAIHLLLWGYNRPKSARFTITFTDGTFQECELPLKEWTTLDAGAAFDFQNTVPEFKHAAITQHEIRITPGGNKISRIASTDGAFGLIAITLGPARQK